MKQLLALILVLALSCSAMAEIAVGYKTVLYYPYAFTLLGYDKESGLGIEGAADFSTSILSLFVNSFGMATITSVFTLAVTKDFIQAEDNRYYVKGGTFGIFGTANAGYKTNIVGLIGVGMEHRGFFNPNFAVNAEFTYPETLTIGVRGYL